MRDIANNIEVVASVVPAVITSTPTPPTATDLRGFNSAMVVFAVGAADVANADETYLPGLEESDTLGSGFTAVDSGDLDGAVTTLLLNTVRKIGYKGTKRYIRPIITIAGTTPSIAVGAVIAKGNPDQKPVA